MDSGSRRLVVDPADLNFPLAMQSHGSLLVHSVTTSNGVRRAVVDVRTGATTTLPLTAALVWSPDGGLLAAPRSNGIELLRPDGTGRRTINTGIPSSFLAWSPDGSRIAFASWRAFPEYSGRGGTPTRYDVYSVAVDGSDLRRSRRPTARSGCRAARAAAGRASRAGSAGRGGNDRIEAGSGVDTVVAGPGRDVVLAGGGGDTIRIRDGERDVVDCGTETDVAYADVRDVLRHCERVHRR